MLSKLYWYFLQLFPLTYRTFYLDERGLLHFAVWKMWFGRCYRTNDVYVDTLLTVLDDTLRALEAAAQQSFVPCTCDPCPEALGELPPVT
jgi:hypothetical protein